MFHHQLHRLFLNAEDRIVDANAKHQPLYEYELSDLRLCLFVHVGHLFGIFGH